MSQLRNTIRSFSIEVGYISALEPAILLYRPSRDLFMNESEFETPPSKLQVGVVGAGVVATEAHIPILSSRDDVEDGV